MYDVKMFDVHGDIHEMTVDLKTARYLMQREADSERLDEHLKQKPLTWTRNRCTMGGKREVFWTGWIDSKFYVALTLRREKVKPSAKVFVL